MGLTLEKYLSIVTLDKILLQEAKYSIKITLNRFHKKKYVSQISTKYSQKFCKIGF